MKRANTNTLLMRLQKPEYLFLLLSTIQGIIFLIYTPPFQAPDEINHFYRAYHISRGNAFGQIMDSRIGGFVPESMKIFTDKYQALTWDIVLRTSRNEILSSRSIELSNDSVFVDFPNTAIYSPICYLPQATAIKLTSIFSESSFVFFYVARIASLFLWVILGFISLKTLPVFKPIVTLLLLLPMSIFINSSISADVVVNSITILFFSFVVKCIVIASKISIGEQIAILLMSVIISSTKLIYFPVVLMILLIPSSRFQSITHHHLFRTAIFLLSILALVSAYFITKNLYIPFDLYNISYRDNATISNCANVSEQIQIVQSDIFLFISTAISSLHSSFPMYSRGIVGTFGWLDVLLPVWYIILFYIAMFFTTAFTDNKAAYKISLKARGLFILISVTIVFSILLSQYLIWDCVGNSRITNLQGRYFLPALPFIIIGLKPYLKLDYKLHSAIFFVWLIGLFVSYDAIDKRYYRSPFYDITELFSDCENLTDGMFFVFNNTSVQAGNGDTQTSIKSLSGQYSCLLLPERPYGMTYTLKDCSAGDIIDVKVYKSGIGGEIIIASDDNRLYYSINQTKEDTLNSWDMITGRVILPRDFYGGRIHVFIYNSQNDSVFFDDYSLRYMRHNFTLNGSKSPLPPY